MSHLPPRAVTVFERAFEHSPIGMLLTSLDGRVLKVNEAVCTLLGLARAQLLERELEGLVHPDDRAKSRASVRAVVSGEREMSRLEVRSRHPRGSDVLLQITITLGQWELGRADCLLLQVQDLAPRRALEGETSADLRRDVTKQQGLAGAVGPYASALSDIGTGAIAASLRGVLLAAAIESMVDIVVVVDRAGRVLLMSEVAKILYGDLQNGEIPDTWKDGYGVFLPDQVTRCDASSYPVVRALTGEIVEQEEFWVRLPSWSEGRWHSVTGTPIRNEKGVVVAAVSIGRDITPQKLLEHKLPNVALRDELTGLYNRRGFWAIGTQQLRAAHHYQRQLVLLVIDIAATNLVNDGSRVRALEDRVVEAALVLQHCSAESDVVARIHADRFAILTEIAESKIECFTGMLREVATQRDCQSADGLGAQMKIGWSTFDPARPCSLSELIGRAHDSKWETEGPDTSTKRGSSHRSA